MTALIVLAVLALFVLVILAKTVRVIPQARAGVVERLGRYSRTLTPGLALVIPFVDRVRPLLDLREQAVSFEPQPVMKDWEHRQGVAAWEKTLAPGEAMKIKVRYNIRYPKEGSVSGLP